MSKTRLICITRATLAVPLVLIASIGLALPAVAQSQGGTDTPAPARSEAKSRPATGSATTNVFTYDAVGATPQVRKPGTAKDNPTSMPPSGGTTKRLPQDTVKEPARAVPR